MSFFSRHLQAQLPDHVCLSCFLFLSPPACCVVSAQPRITVQFRYRHSLAFPVSFSSIFVENLSPSHSNSQMVSDQMLSKIPTEHSRNQLIPPSPSRRWYPDMQLTEQKTALPFRWTSGENIYGTRFNCSNSFISGEFLYLKILKYWLFFQSLLHPENWHLCQELSTLVPFFWWDKKLAALQWCVKETHCVENIICPGSVYNNNSTTLIYIY